MKYLPALAADYLLPTIYLPSTALTSDDLDTPRSPVQIMLFVAGLLIYGRTFYRGLYLLLKLY